MKFIHILVVLALVTIMGSCDSSGKESKTSHSSDLSLKTLEDSVNYLIGQDISMQFSYFNEEDYHPDMMELAYEDYIKGKGFRVNDAQKKDILTHYFRWARANKDDSLMRQSIRWLKANGKTEGINMTKRGAQYSYMKKGNGLLTPDGNDLVEIRYVQGTPFKGIIWDQSIDPAKREIVKVALNQHSSGFSEICQLMKEGDKVKAWLPPKIGSAEDRDLAGLAVKNEVVYMEIELLKIHPRKSSELTVEEFRKFPGYFIDESRRDN